MQDKLVAISDAIGGTDGWDLLRVMRVLYHGADDVSKLSDVTEKAEAVVRVATSLKLLRGYGAPLSLTDLGYLVGNVAREYCHWVDHGRSMPPPRPPEEFIRGKDILDLGCGCGRWLWEFQTVARSVVGLEMQPAFVELGRVLARRENVEAPDILLGSADRLDECFAGNSFDFVFCRLMANYNFITPLLRSVSRVIRPGGILWLQVESISNQFRKLLRPESGRGLRSVGFSTFVILNSLVFMATSRQMCIRSQGRMVSEHKPAYPTKGAWKRAVLAADFSNWSLISPSGSSYAFYAVKNQS